MPHAEKVLGWETWGLSMCSEDDIKKEYESRVQNAKDNVAIIIFMAEILFFDKLASIGFRRMYNNLEIGVAEEYRKSQE